MLRRGTRRRPPVMASPLNGQNPLRVLPGPFQMPEVLLPCGSSRRVLPSSRSPASSVSLEHRPPRPTHPSPPLRSPPVSLGPASAPLLLPSSPLLSPHRSSFDP